MPPRRPCTPCAMHALPGAPGGGGNEKAPQKRGREGLPCTVPALMGQPLRCRAPDSQDRAPCRSPRHAAPSTLGVAVMGRPGVAPPLWRRLVFIPRTSARRQSCGVRCPRPLAVAHPSDLWPMPQGKCRSLYSSSATAHGGVPAPSRHSGAAPAGSGSQRKSPQGVNRAGL